MRVRACWACGALVQRSSRSCGFRSSTSPTPRGCAAVVWILRTLLITVADIPFLVHPPMHPNDPGRCACLRFVLPCPRCVYLLCVRLLCMLSFCAIAHYCTSLSCCVYACLCSSLTSPFCGKRHKRSLWDLEIQRVRMSITPFNRSTVFKTVSDWP